MPTQEDVLTRISDFYDQIDLDESGTVDLGELNAGFHRMKLAKPIQLSVEDFDLLTEHGLYTTKQARGGEEIDALGFQKMMLNQLRHYTRRKVQEAMVKAQANGEYNQFFAIKAILISIDNLQSSMQDSSAWSSRTASKKLQQGLTRVSTFFQSWRAVVREARDATFCAPEDDRRDGGEGGGAGRQERRSQHGGNTPDAPAHRYSGGSAGSLKDEEQAVMGAGHDVDGIVDALHKIEGRLSAKIASETKSLSTVIEGLAVRLERLELRGLRTSSEEGHCANCRPADVHSGPNGPSPLQAHAHHRALTRAEASGVPTFIKEALDPQKHSEWACSREALEPCLGEERVDRSNTSANTRRMHYGKGEYSPRLVATYGSPCVRGDLVLSNVSQNGADSSDPSPSLSGHDAAYQPCRVADMPQLDITAMPHQNYDSSGHHINAPSKHHTHASSPN